MEGCPGECRCTKEDAVPGHAGGCGGDAGAPSEGCHGLPEEQSWDDAWGLSAGEGGEVPQGIGSTKDDEEGRRGKPGGQCWGMQRDAGRCRWLFTEQHRGAQGRMQRGQGIARSHAGGGRGRTAEQHRGTRGDAGGSARGPAPERVGAMAGGTGSFPEVRGEGT